MFGFGLQVLVEAFITHVYIFTRSSDVPDGLSKSVFIPLSRSLYVISGQSFLDFQNPKFNYLVPNSRSPASPKPGIM